MTWQIWRWVEAAVRRHAVLAIVACGAALAASHAAAAPIVVDGRFADWGSGPADAVDPAGDHAGGAWDLRRVWARGEGSTVFVRFEIDERVNLPSGPNDDGDLVLTARVNGSLGERAVHVDFRGRTWTLEHDAESEDIGWKGVNYRAAPTHASDQFEVSLDLEALGANVGGVVRLSFSGDDALGAPLEVALEPKSAEPVRTISHEKPAGTVLRVASLNSYRNGLVHPERSAALFRLLRAVDADVYCIQEEFETSRESIREAFAREMGGEPRDWTVRKSPRGTAVVTRRESHTVRFGDAPAAGLTIDADNGERVLIASLHLKCCGNVGSDEDARRINQMGEIVRAMKRGRKNRRASASLLIGDWNLVGSTKPLDIARDEEMRWLLPRQLNSMEPMTWYNPESAFSPGQLDLAVFSNDTMERSRAFTIDSRQLTPGQLQELGLNADDSAATDHLLLVVDLVEG